MSKMGSIYESAERGKVGVSQSLCVHMIVVENESVVKLYAGHKRRGK